MFLFFLIMQFLSYLFWPNPGGVMYSSTKIVILLAICASFIVLSFVLRLWRKKHPNPISRKLSRSWPSALFWFGVAGLVLTVSRAEGLSFVSMRVWIFRWGVSFVLYFLFQWRQFRTRHYELVRTEKQDDPRNMYLPKKKR